VPEAVKFLVDGLIFPVQEVHCFRIRKK
jgi:hypothetical protein